MLATTIGGRYLIEQELGRGSFGAVYAATDPDGERVAVKLLSAFEGSKRFHAEADILRRLPPHPNVVRFLDSGLHGGGLPFLVLELVHGETLAALVQREWPPLDRVLAIAQGVLRGLAHLHRHGVLHRDLNAGNIIVDESGEPRIVDFGLALDTERLTRFTRTGETVGTPSLLAPEQLAGGELTAAVDIYAVSSLVYFLVTKTMLFSDSKDAASFVKRVREEVPPLADAVAPSVPAWLAKALAEGLAKNPADRPRSADELARLLRPAPVELALRPGETFGPFVLGERLGRGGAGLVHRARDTRSGREVALKVLLDAQEARARSRFAREASILTRVRDPGIVSVLDAGEVGALPWLALELVEGETLDAAIRRGLPAREAARIVAQVARALAAAHEAGIVHRDVKPENVVLDASGRPRLVDFGVAGPIGAGTQSVGTLAYLSPEQARGEQAREASDIWGLGAILYEAIAKRPPHDAASPVQALAAAQEGRVVPPRVLVPEVPRELDAICLRALAPDPGERHATARDVARELEAFVERDGFARRALRVAAGPFRRAAAFARREPRNARALLLVVLLASGLYLWLDARLSMARTLDALNARALRYEALGYPELALEDYARAIELSPDDSKAWFNRGDLKLRLADAAGARADLDRAVALAPRRSDNWHVRARVRLALGDREGARSDVERALDLLRAVNPGLHATAAEVRLALGDADGALAAAAKALASDPRHGRALAARGRARALKGDRDAARGDLERALSLVREPDQIAAIRSSLAALAP